LAPPGERHSPTVNYNHDCSRAGSATPAVAVPGSNPDMLAL
jgi:hypothetical protein